MLRASFTGAEKVTEFDRRHPTAGGEIGFVQDKRAPIVVSAEKPPVAVFTVVNLTLVIRHISASRVETINRDPESFHQLSERPRFRAVGEG
jgi:hypothetical protein